MKKIIWVKNSNLFLFKKTICKLQKSSLQLHHFKKYTYCFAKHSYYHRISVHIKSCIQNAHFLDEKAAWSIYQNTYYGDNTLLSGRLDFSINSTLCFSEER